jgi:hypothetical protein
MSDQQLYLDSMKTNQFNYDVLTKDLREFKTRSFDYLSRIQKLAAGYHRYNFKASDMKVIKVDHSPSIVGYPGNYTLFMEHDFIVQSKRLAYKRSALYNKELTPSDIAHNTDVFSSAYMVFIEGKFIDCTKIICREDTTYLIIETQEWGNTIGLPKDYIIDMMTRDVDITVWIIPNAVYGVFDTNIHVLNYYKQYLSLDNFNIAGNLADELTYISFINNTSFKFAGVVCDTTNSQDMMRFYTGNASLPFDSKLLHLNVFGLRNLLDQVLLPTGTTIFQIPNTDMPIPVENMMVFRTINGERYFAHDVQIQIHYPDVFEVIQNSLPQYDLSIFVFYATPPSNHPLMLRNEVELFYRYFPDVLTRYRNSTIPSMIKDYDPKQYEYDMQELESLSLLYSSLTYKFQKINEFLAKDPSILTNYYRDLLAKIRNFYIDVSTLDLPSKLRSNNHAEIADPGLQESFPETMYLFTFKNESVLSQDELIFIIDGFFIDTPYRYDYDNYRFYYIPSRLIHSNSFIDIEKVPLFNTTQVITLDDINTRLNIVLDNRTNQYIKAADVFLTDPNNSDNYIDRALYDILIVDRFGDTVPITSTTCREIGNSFYIQALDVSITGINLVLHIEKVNLMHKFEVTNPAITTTEMPISLNNDITYIKIFKNNALLPRHIYDIQFNPSYNIHATVGFLMGLHSGEVYTIIPTAYKYRQVYYTATIPSNGLVQITSDLGRPIEMETFEIHLNGQKLNRNNVELLTPSAFLIKNVHSLKNLEILERELDPTAVFDGLPVSTISDEILTLLSFTNTITDTSYNIIGEYIDPYTLSLIRLYNEVLFGLSLINPDIDQITQFMRDNYTPPLVNGEVFMFFTDVAGANNPFIINPNVPH